MVKNFWLSVVVGICLYVATIFSIFLVQGDGRAPALTKFLLLIMEEPGKLFGLKFTTGLEPWELVFGAIFWAAVTFGVLSVASLFLSSSSAKRR